MRALTSPGRLCAVLLLLVLCLPGCASAPQAGTGDVSFRLTWKGRSDLDLHVVDPGGEELYFLSRSSGSGGVLDVDCNGAYDQVCDQPIENVFWPSGSGPRGHYKFWVSSYAIIPAEAPIEARVVVLEGTKIVAEHLARITASEQQVGPFEYELR